MDIFKLFWPDFDFIILQSLLIALAAMLLPRLKVTSLFGPILTAIAISWFNEIYWDSSLFFNLPDSFTPKTLLLLLSNALIFWVLVKILPGIEISGFLSALLAPVIITLCSYLIRHYVGDIDWLAVFNFVKDLFNQARIYFLSSKAT